MFVQKWILVQNNIWAQKIFVNKNVCSKKKFGFKKILGPAKFLVPTNSEMGGGVKTVEPICLNYEKSTYQILASNYC